MKKSTNRNQNWFSADKIVTTVHQLIKRDLLGKSQLPEDAARHLVMSMHDCKKKYIDDDCSPEKLKELTFDKFIKVNNHMKGFQSSDWFQYMEESSCPRGLALRRAKKLVHWILHGLELDEVVSGCKNSGGVSLGVPFSDTSVKRKFAFPITITASAAPYYREVLSHDYQLCEAIESFNRSGSLQRTFARVRGSRATTVPKTNSINRMIAIEPTGNMYLQQGLMLIMYKRLKKVGLNVATLPDKHVQLARQGSIDGLLATIDFSSASDCLSIELLRYLLPSSWFTVLNDIRCEEMDLNGSFLNLNMFSTMGNATTFPLETIVFYCLAVASVMQHRRKPWDHRLALPTERRCVSVFGDDCIIPTDCAKTFMDLCTSVGFIVNSEKSFFDPEDPFRESCGGDFLHGHNVRPLYFKRPATEKKSNFEPFLYTLLNRVLPFYRNYFGETSYIYGKHVLRYLFSLFRRHQLLVKALPPDYPDDSGLLGLDLKRLIRHYELSFSKLRVTKQGTKLFLYHSFRYRKRQEVDDGIQYALRLKQLDALVGTNQRLRHLPANGEKLQTLFTPVRRLGGYVVARGDSVRWTED